MGRFQTKSKVIHSVRVKSCIFRRHGKQERSHTPQRWSRRIRSLPPIPLNILETHRKPTKNECGDTSPVGPEGDLLNFAGLILNSFTHKKDSKSDVLVSKNIPQDDTNSPEVIRVVPVVVYLKEQKPRFKAFLDDYEIDIKKRSSPQNITTSKKNMVQKKIKQECSVTEQRASKRLKLASQSPTNFALKD